MKDPRRNVRGRRLLFENLEDRKVLAGFLYIGSDVGPVATVKVFGDAAPSPLDGQYEQTVQVFQPFGGFKGGARVATGNFDGDSNAELVVAAGPNGKTEVKIFDLNGDGSIGTLLDSFFAFGQTATTGVNVVAADANNDGRSELWVSQDQGGGRVRAYRDTDNDLLLSDNLFDQFFPYGASFTGGVTVAAGDTNNSAGTELIVGQASGGSRVKIYADSDADSDFSDEAVLETFNAFPAAYTGGVNLSSFAIQSVGGGGAEVAVSGAKNSRAVRIYTDSDNTGKVGDNPIAEGIFAYPTNIAGGVRIALGDTDHSSFFAELITVPGSGVAAEVQIFDDSSDAGVLLGDDPPVQTFNAFPITQKSGAFVAFGRISEETFSSTGFPLSIGDSSTVNSSIFVPKGAGIVRDLDINLSIFHTFNGDLELTLTHVRTGKSLVLFQDVGSSNEGFFIRLNDEAGTDITSASNPKADGAISGTFNPGGAALLSLFDGDDASGEWRLSVTDDAGGDTGTLFGWSMVVNYGT